MKKKIASLLNIFMICLATQTSFGQQTEGGQFFTIGDVIYSVTNFNPQEVAVSEAFPTDDFIIPSSVTNQGLTFSVVEIFSDAFENSTITSVEIPATIQRIGFSAFRDFSNTLTQVTALGNTPPTLRGVPFTNAGVIALTVPVGTEEAYVNNGWVGFNTINGTPVTFDVSNITYSINSFSEETVAVIKSSITNANVTIPSAVTFNNITYQVTEIRPYAFSTNQITGISIPNTVTKIGEDAFSSNQLTSIVLPDNITTIETATFLNNQITSVTIPALVTDIGSIAFFNNPITTIDVLATTPPTVNSNSFSNPGTIDVTVPVGTEAAYTAAGWNIFRSINGQIQFTVGTTFTENDFDYEVSSMLPNEVRITGGINVPQDLVIGATVTSQGTTFSVVEVGFNAFENLNLTSVQLPNTLRSIKNFAFQNNQITNLTIPTSVTRIDFRAFRSNQIGGDLVIPNTVTSLGNGAFELNNLTSVSISENISSIGNQTFRSNQLTTVTIPANINSLGDSCFRSNPLTEVIVLNPTPLTFTGGDPFLNNRGNIALTVPTNTELNYLVSGWIGFASINGQDPAFFNEFEDNNVTYRITTLSPNVVQIVDSNVTGELIVPTSATNGTENFSITTIGDSAFQNNQLTTVIIPASITNVGRRAFRDNPLKTVILEGFTPPVVNNQSNSNNTFTDRSSIDLYVPTGTEQAYTSAGWSNFKSISGVSKALIVNVYLQGASLHPNTGEENLMRDDLRIAGLIPGVSPYGDGALIFNNTFVNNTTGENAIVDWVFIELRDPNDQTVIVESKSALLQRDGDVVGMDAITPIQFIAALDDYFVTIQHRNHLGITSLATKELRSTANVLNFSDANNPVTFGSNAQTDAGMPTNTLGMWAGNVNGDTIVQYQGGTPDTTAILSAALNDPGNFLNFSTFIINGYNNNDVDMNGTTQYEGGSADSPLILQNVLAHPGNFLNFSTFQILEQLP